MRPIALPYARLFLCLAAFGWLSGRPALVLAGPRPASWIGVLRDDRGHPVADASIELREAERGRAFQASTSSEGAFVFSNLVPGRYVLSVRWHQQAATLEKPFAVQEGERLTASLELSRHGRQVSVLLPAAEAAEQASGGQTLSGREVSTLPLNKRDFSQLLLLAAGTMTDTNGAANFTQQFAVNGQRATTAVFAMDGVDISDPELGGATFANFNVDAIREIKSESGVMTADIGRGAAGFTDVLTKSGTEEIHGTLFEFLRNAALDARNFFDRRSLVNPGRIPPFRRNEFGFTNGGPLVLPGINEARHRTYYFAQYQGFRQVLGTTQVLAVPSLRERQGLDTTAFPGDTLLVPVSPAIAPVLAHYPAPNDPEGAFGARTFATSSKVAITSDQFSLRIDHRASEKTQLFARFNWDNTNGPLTNPNQAAIDPSFAIRFTDNQRNAAFSVTRTVSPHFVWDMSLDFIRSTPFFRSSNHAQPGLQFSDGLYEPFNGPSGLVFGAFGNLFQLRQNFSFLRGTHAFQTGFEARFNRDTVVFGASTDGAYTFGGGSAYAPVAIPSASGRHDIHPGDPLPDSLSGFLTATPYSFTASVAAPLFPQGNRIGEAGVHREAYNVYFEDSWKVTGKLVLNYGLRYEANTRIHEPHHLTATPRFVGPGGRPARFWDPGTHEILLINPQPPYRADWNGWGPRVSLDWHASKNTTWHAAGALTTLLPNLFQDNGLSGGMPFVFYPFLTAFPGAPVPFHDAVVNFTLPPVYTPQGLPVFATGRSTDVPANTPIDLSRFENDLATLTPGHQPQPQFSFGMARNFVNGYVETYTAGFDRSFGDATFSVAYVGAAGVSLVAPSFPNSYSGADPAHALFTSFDSSGHAVGGYGPEIFISSGSHSAYHALQTSLSKTSPRAGLGLQASYTFSKSLDDTSSLSGAFAPTTGTILQGPPQDPWNPGREKGPSTFDIRQVMVFSIIQVLPFDRWAALQRLPRALSSGWQFLNISSFASGAPFSVFSGIQQTAFGSIDADRPDQVGTPLVSTSRTVREDYFGRGAANSDFFFIPINLLTGTGPNHGRLGALGRGTFRGPIFHNFDAAIIKDTPFGHRGKSEAGTLEFRAEFFNVFNLVNFAFPSNTVLGSGFGIISRTASPSRQIQFSLKLFY